ncbi:MAG: alpha/beta hydrolase [Propionicimonas sp.]|nr:alpha/beta hydrolase [Propionicimonas sp.]
MRLGAAGRSGAAGSGRPPSPLAERWTTLNGVDVFYRESGGPGTGTVMVHLHGFGLSGRYLLPTAERLSGDFHTFVPDLPGFGRSGKVRGKLDVPDLARAAAAFLDDRGIERASLVGNSMGCPVICEFAYQYPDRIDRAILVSPAGGRQNQPLPRAMGQIAQDAFREPPRLFPVVVPDYLRFGVTSTRQLFHSLTRYPALQRLLDLQVPTLAVVGSHDPLMPGPQRTLEVARQTGEHVSIVVIDGAAHAINFSHPGELANVIRQFMTDRPIVDDPDSPGRAFVAEIHRGMDLPSYG